MPKLSYEVFVTALAVLSSSATACQSAKRSEASPEPVPVNQAPGATMPAPAADPAPPPPAEVPLNAAPAATTAPEDKRVQKAGPGFPPGAASVEPAKENTPKPTVNKKGSAACGAGACSGDMKK